MKRHRSKKVCRIKLVPIKNEEQESINTYIDEAKEAYRTIAKGLKEWHKKVMESINKINSRVVHSKANTTYKYLRNLELQIVFGDNKILFISIYMDDMTIISPYIRTSVHPYRKLSFQDYALNYFAPMYIKFFEGLNLKVKDVYIYDKERDIKSRYIDPDKINETISTDINPENIMADTDL